MFADVYAFIAAGRPCDGLGPSQQLPEGESKGAWLCATEKWEGKRNKPLSVVIRPDSLRKETSSLPKPLVDQALRGGGLLPMRGGSGRALKLRSPFFKIRLDGFHLVRTPHQFTLQFGFEFEACAFVGVPSLL